MKSAQEQLLTTQVELQARARDADQFRQLLSEHDADSERYDPSRAERCGGR